jgi:hypothetical protein
VGPGRSEVNMQRMRDDPDARMRTVADLDEAEVR